MMVHFELTPEGKQVITDSVREIATPVLRSWESTAAFICFVIYILARPLVSSRTPYLLDRTVLGMVADFVMLAICAGCGLSAARNPRRRGRLMGAIILAASIIAICDWGHLLLNWRTRWWG